MVAGTIAAPTPGRFDRVFFSGMFFAAAVIVLVGFAPTYYLRARYVAEPLPPLLQLHGALFSSWILLVVVQTMLVAARRVSWHRVLGAAGAVLAALVVVAGTSAGIATARREAANGLEDAARAFLTIPLFSMAVFAGLVFAGIAWRSRPQTHKRLMLLATISILDAPLARWPGAPGATGVALLLALFVAGAMVYDAVTRGRVHPAYLWGGTAVLLGQWLRDIVGQTSAWASFAGTIIG
jgi:hypothetical protein